jgi:polyadenylate-binding protein
MTGAPNFAYTKQARNKEVVPSAPLNAIAPITQAGLPGVTGQDSLTPDALAGMTPEQQKNALGERLFARISETHPDYAAKITGMLLEMDVTETLNLLETPHILNSKIEEALDVLKTHEEQGGITAA